MAKQTMTSTDMEIVPPVKGTLVWGKSLLFGLKRIITVCSKLHVYT